MIPPEFQFDMEKVEALVQLQRKTCLLHNKDQFIFIKLGLV
jgi:hypothetical protein